jgi:hypothetical protein
MKVFMNIKKRCKAIRIFLFSIDRIMPLSQITVFTQSRSEQILKSEAVRFQGIHIAPLVIKVYQTIELIVVSMIQ